jgi:hypothetical protein
MRYKDPIEEISELNACIEGVNSLLSPGLSLNGRSRDSVAILLGRLIDQQRRAIDVLHNQQRQDA